MCCQLFDIHVLTDLDSLSVQTQIAEKTMPIQRNTCAATTQFLHVASANECMLSVCGTYKYIAKSVINTYVKELNVYLVSTCNHLYVS